MSSKSTWLCAEATPPGGIVATFIDNLVEPTFLALRPTLYWMLFQLRQFLLPRMTEIPSPPSTLAFRSGSGVVAIADIGAGASLVGEPARPATSSETRERAPGCRSRDSTPGMMARSRAWAGPGKFPF